MDVKSIYNTEFYNNQKYRSLRAAGVILPYLFQFYKPNSVIDIGCGSGSWLRACQDLGVGTIHGVDINEVDEQTLFVPRDVIDIFDFSNLTSQEKFAHSQKYDLAISLEVAEHLEPQNAVSFVKYLTSFSDVVLFSAAHPFQSGVHHVNCQPAVYWSSLFKNEDYVCVDIMRRQLMFVPQLDECYWYGQNSFLYVHNSCENVLKSLQDYITDAPVSYYHQAVVNEIVHQMNGMSSRLTKMETSLWYRIQRKLKKILRRKIDY
ncbi:MAG: methyltransferase domain-containing protein [Thermoguttaceae bacterium]|nr:methyltransferase domain-containing protein [Thermoguttaceae bacterium]